MLTTSVKNAPESTTIPVWRPLANRLVKFLEEKNRAGTWNDSKRVFMTSRRMEKLSLVVWVFRKSPTSFRLAFILEARLHTKWQ